MSDYILMKLAAITAQLISLRAKRNYMAEFPYNKDFQLEVRVIDVQIKQLQQEADSLEGGHKNAKRK